MRARTLEALRASGELPRFAGALARLRSLGHEADPQLRDYFSPDPPVFIANAPGRLDVMGGIADYSGALVLQLPLELTTSAILQLQVKPAVDVVSLRGAQPYWFSAELELLLGGTRTTENLATWFAEHEADRWAAYPLGVIHACLARSRTRPRGIRLLIESRVPEGKGVSSSAALEVACLAVVAAAYDAPLSAEEIALESQWAENRVAGAPCGIMDQMTSACGRQDHLLRLRCQPGRVEGQLAIPAGYRFYGIDSGVSHAVSGADYATVRTAAFMGYRIIADMAGMPAVHDGARVKVEDRQWHGYLANVSPSVFRERYESQLPPRMLGADFLTRYHGITDTVTSVQPDRWYPVRQATAHPVYENARVEEFATRLEMLYGAASTEVAMGMGRAMYESHASYGDCGLGSEGTDRLVELVSEAGAERGLYGAKITGGGSGGTAAVFGTAAAEPVVREIARRYSSETNRPAEVFARSGPGLAETGVLALSAADHQDVRRGSTSA